MRDKMESIRSKIGARLHWYIILATISYIGIMLVLSYLIDVRAMNTFGLGTWLEQTRPTYSLFWIFAFTEASPTEHLQWALLTTCIVLTAAHLKIRHQTDSVISLGWVILLVGLSLMLLEDTYNVRHKTVDFIEYYFDVRPSARVWFLSLRGLVEIAMYSILGSIMMVGLVSVLRSAEESLTGKKFLLIGYGCYFVASFCSATRGIGNWYTKLGNIMVEHLNSEWAVQVTHPLFQGHVGFYFVDFVLEESVELLGAAFIAASLVIFIGHASHEREIARMKANSMSLNPNLPNP